MTTILRFVQILALGIWLGGIVFLSFAVAPHAFAMLASRHQAGAIVGMALARLHFMGLACGVAYLLAAVFRLRSLSALAAPAAVAVLSMLALTMMSQFWVSARMADLRAQMATEHGSIDQTPQGHPLRAEFGRLHGISTALELAVLLLGLAALYFTMTQV